MASDLVDVAGAARILGVEPGMVRRLVLERRIDYVKVGRYVRFRPAALERWIDEHTVPEISR